MKPLYDTLCMRVMQGIAASPGIGLGKAFLYIHEKLTIPHVRIGEGEIGGEVERFTNALKAVAAEISQMAKATPVDNSEKIVETHLLMLEDPEFTKAVENLITTEKVCAEWAVERILNSIIETVEQGSDPLLRERSADLSDIRLHLIKELMGRSHSDLSMINEEVILVADN